MAQDFCKDIDTTCFSSGALQVNFHQDRLKVLQMKNLILYFILLILGILFNLYLNVGINKIDFSKLC